MAKSQMDLELKAKGKSTTSRRNTRNLSLILLTVKREEILLMTRMMNTNTKIMMKWLL